MRNRHSCQGAPCGNSGGFTLIEMLVVIAVLGIVVAMMAGFGPPKNRWLQTQGAAQRVAAAMQQAGTLAITSGKPVPLSLPALPSWLTVSADAPAGGIVFEPDGSAMGGTIRLTEAGREIDVTADWLTGRPIILAP